MSILENLNVIETDLPVQRTKVAKPTVLLTWRRLKCASLPLGYTY